MPIGTLAEVAGRTGELGIVVHEVGFVWKAEPTVTCLACSCPRGDALVVRVRAADAVVLADFGFAELGAAPQLRPIQCSGNAWETGSGDAEIDLVRAWLDGSSAVATDLGFTYHTEQQALCRACSWPRGDRLIVLPAADEAQAFAPLGFADVYIP